MSVGRIAKGVDEEAREYSRKVILMMWTGLECACLSKRSVTGVVAYHIHPADEFKLFAQMS